MIGDILYVDRKPLLWRSTKNRRNPNSKKLDIVIFRMTKYRHYGIDLGDGRVIHFQGDSVWSRGDSSIDICSIDEFLKDGILGIVEDVPYKYSREEVVDRASEFLGTRFGGYKLIHNNCEHFVMWCATDLRMSRQAVLWKYGYNMMAFPKKVLLRR